jgi:hypothetical protein
MANSKRSGQKEAYWRGVLKAYRGSGLTVRAYCRKAKISEPSFFAWRKKIEQRDANRRSGPTLIPVEVVGPAQAALLEVVTPNGFTLRVRPDIDPQHLSVVLATVSSCGGGGGPC